jgi:gliding motility-associated-like protein
MTMTRIFHNRFVIIIFLCFSFGHIAAQPLTPLGNASPLGGLCYTLTPNAAGQAGGIYSTITIDLNEPWTFTALMAFGSTDAAGADGIAFVLTPNPVLGFPGGGLCFAGLTPSIGIEFDSYSNPEFSDPVDDHMAIQRNGNVVHGTPDQLSPSVNLGNIETGLTYCATITWNPATDVLFCNFNGYTTSYTGDIINTIFGGNPIVHYGFTSATGLAFNGHSICVVPVAPGVVEDVTICQGETAYLQADPYALTWSWQPHPSLSSTTISNPQADPLTTTTYIVNTTYFCSGTASDTATVTVMPDLSANASNNGPQCEYEIITLNAWGGESYSWSGPGGFTSNDDNPTIEATLANAGTYTVTIYDDNACSHVATTIVNVYPTPAVAITPPAGTICEDANPVQLNATPPGGEWGGNISPTGLFNPASAGPGDHAIEYYYQDANNCSASDEIIVTVTPSPAVDITPLAQPLCADAAPVQLNATPAGGTWSGNISPTGIFNPATAGIGDHIITYAYTDANNCSADDVITVTVVPIPIVTITPPAQPLCEDSAPVQLTGTPPGGVWSGNISPTGIFDPVTAGNHVITYSYTDGNNCSSDDQITLTVVAATPVNITSLAQPLCEDSNPVQLNATPSGGVWSGTISPTGIFNPSTAGIGDHTITYSYTDGNNCISDDDIILTVVAVPTVTITPIAQPICVNGAPVQLNASPSGGVWSGIVSPTGIFNPATAGTGDHVITYSYTDANNCSSDDAITVTVVAAPVVNITAPPQPFCEDGDPVQLNATPAGGTWSGTILPTGIFNPGTAGTGNHVITYTYTDGNNCSDDDDITLSVVQNNTAVITPPGPFCEDVAMITLVANPPGGTWGGAANASGQIFPNALNPGTHMVSYDLTTPSACYNTAINIEVVAVTVLTLPAIPDFCEDDAAYQLTGFDPPGGVFSGDASPTGLIQPQSLPPGLHQVTYTYTPAVCPVVSGSETFEVFGSPIAQNIDRICDATATNFTVQFDITGGDPSSYEVEGTVPGNIVPGSPTQFISAPIPSGSSYTFEIFDENHCDTAVVTGSYLCNCVTSEGTMNQTPITVCEGETIFVPAATGYVLDGDDVIIYVLHTGNPLEYIVIGNGTTFEFEPPVEAGVNYFVDALIGNMSGGGVDLDDPCLAVMSGPAVMWQANPTGSFTGPADICDGEDAVLTFTMTGIGPFDITYLVENTPVTIANVGSPYSITVTPDENTSYTFSSVTDNGGATCAADIDITIEIAVSDVINAEADVTICEGETIFLGGAWQDSPGTYVDMIAGVVGCDTILTTYLSVAPVETTFTAGTSCHPEDVGVFENTYTSANGCDSIVISTITLVTSDTTYQFETTCDADEEGTFSTLYVGEDGCDSLNIVIVTLNESDTTYQSDVTCNPAEAGTFTETLTGENGCDSLVITTVTFTSGDTTYIDDTSCIVAEVGESTEVFTDQDGCDSTVITTITYALADTTYVDGTTCDEQQVGVFENTYSAQNGCDSTVITTITLTTADTTYVSGTSCLIAEGGVFTNTLTAQNGCDSVIISTITLINVDTTNIPGTTCDPQQAGVFAEIFTGDNGCDSVVISTIALVDADTTNFAGTTCDAQQVGVFTNIYTAQNGCDSIVISTITLTDADTTTAAGTTCDAQQVGVFTNTYTAQNGCDSVVISTITLTTPDTSYTTGTTCDEQQVGVFTNTYTGQNGCDSIVISTITLTSASTTNVTGTTCDPQQVGVFTNTYIGQNGCDSIVISTITLTTPVTTNVTGTTCDAQQVGVFTDIYTAQNGCDSIVISTITLTTPITTNVTGTTCDAQQVGVFTDIYTAQNGCDSIVISTITLTTPITTNVTGTTCDVQQVGTFSNTYTAQNGCDSTVISTITLTTVDTSHVSSTSCDELQTGVFTNTYTAQNGCDSVVIETISFASGDTILIELASCMAVDTGTIITTFQAANGCDSVVIQHTEWLSHEIRIFSAGTCLVSDTGAIVQEFVNMHGCDSIIIIVTPLLPDAECEMNTSGREVFIPTAFSPNQDGINDAFYIMSDDDNVSSIQWLRIYDRWGGLVMEKKDGQANDPGFGWDGTNDGDLVNPGVFIWQVHLTYADGLEKTMFGDVTLLR